MGRGGEAGPAWPDRWRQVRGTALNHPVAAVAVLAVVVVLHHLWIIHRDRHLGTFDLDEAGYLAQAMESQRLMAADGLDGLRRSLPAETGPLVPLLSSIALAVRPRSAQAALAIQPVLAAVSAVAVTGIVRRTAGAAAALVAGLAALALPVLIGAARGYQLDVGATAALTVAVWALLASEGGRRTGPLVGFGAAVGAMVTARTMTIAFLPALAAAAALVLPATRRTLRGLALAALAGGSVAAPWWALHGRTALAYLTRNGYDAEVAGQYGSEVVFLRPLLRLGELVVTVRPLLLLPAVALWAGAVFAWRRRPEGARWWRSDRGRAVAAVWAVVVLGYLALATSANQGVGFALPLQVIGVAATASLAPALTRRWAGRVAVLAMVGATANLTLVGHTGFGLPATARPGTFRSLLAAPVLFGDRLAVDEPLADVDPRFGFDRSIAEQDAAAAAWWRANVETVWALDRIEASIPGGSIRTLTGSSLLLSANSILLAEEISSQGQRPLLELDAGDPADAFLDHVQPTREGRPNVLVIIQAERVERPQRERVIGHLDAAVAAGWVVREQVDLPDGGRVLMLLPPT